MMIIVSTLWVIPCLEFSTLQGAAALCRMVCSQCVRINPQVVLPVLSWLLLHMLRINRALCQNHSFGFSLPFQVSQLTHSAGRGSCETIG